MHVQLIKPVVKSPQIAGKYYYTLIKDISLSANLNCMSIILQFTSSIVFQLKKNVHRYALVIQLRNHFISFLKLHSLRCEIYDSVIKDIFPSQSIGKIIFNYLVIFCLDFKVIFSTDPEENTHHFINSLKLFFKSTKSLENDSCDYKFSDHFIPDN